VCCAVRWVFTGAKCRQRGDSFGSRGSDEAASMLSSRAAESSASW